MSDAKQKPTEGKISEEDKTKVEPKATPAAEPKEPASEEVKAEAAPKTKPTVDPFVVIHSDPKDKDALVEAMPIGKLGCIVVRKGAAVFVPDARIVTREKVTTLTS